MSAIQAQQLEQILITYEEHKKRKRPNYDSLSSMESHESFKQIIKEGQKQTYLLDNLLDQACRLYRDLFREAVDQKNKYYLLEQKMKNKQQQIESLNDKIASFCEEEEEWRTSQLQNKDQKIAWIIRAKEIQKNYINEIKQLKEEIEKLSALLQNQTEKNNQLQENNDNLNKFISLHEQEKAENKNKIQELELEKDSLKEQLTTMKNKLDWQSKKRESLIQQLKEKEQSSKHLVEEINSLNEALKNPYEQFDYDLHDLVPFQKQFSNEDFIREKLLLSDDVQGSVFSENSDGRANREIMRQSLNQEQKGSLIEMVNPTNPEIRQKKYDIKGKRKGGIIDPYYCHFLLLSQTIQIRENHQSYFNLDIKPHYIQVISEKVPMHEWEKWIIQKFREMSGEVNKIEELKEEKPEKQPVQENKKRKKSFFFS